MRLAASATVTIAGGRWRGMARRLLGCLIVARQCALIFPFVAELVQLVEQRVEQVLVLGHRETQSCKEREQNEATNFVNSRSCQVC